MSDETNVTDVTELSDFQRRRLAKQAKKEIAEMFRNLERAAHKMLDGVLEHRMPELVMHAREGRGFRVHLEVCNSDGTAWAPERQRSAPAWESAGGERLIIAPHEADRD